MRNYLENNGIFYHISPISNRKSIEKNGIRRSNKGICVLRINEMSIINAVINSQLHEINDGDAFIIVAMKIPANEFPIYVFEPDILLDTDWTWPLHNNIVVDCIPPNFITGITTHEYSLHQANIDISSRQLYTNENYYLSSFNLVYENHYSMNTDSTLNNFEERKNVKSCESQYIFQ